jgi:hypothetical protein
MHSWVKRHTIRKLLTASFSRNVQRQWKRLSFCESEYCIYVGVPVQKHSSPQTCPLPHPFPTPQQSLTFFFRNEKKICKCYFPDTIAASICDAIPCMNGGQCSIQDGYFFCTCTNGLNVQPAVSMSILVFIRQGYVWLFCFRGKICMDWP